MSRLRRALVLLAAALALLTGLLGTASAAYSSTARAAHVSVSTTTVAAPTDITARTVSCDNSRYQDVLLTWAASTSSRIRSYQISVYRGKGTTSATTLVGPGTTAVTFTVDRLAVDVSTLRFSVTTRTDYGWTAESGLSGVITC